MAMTEAPDPRHNCNPLFSACVYADCLFTGVQAAYRLEVKSAVMHSPNQHYNTSIKQITHIILHKRLYAPQL